MWIPQITSATNGCSSRIFRIVVKRRHMMPTSSVITVARIPATLSSRQLTTHSRHIFTVQVVAVEVDSTESIHLQVDIAVDLPHVLSTGKE